MDIENILRKIDFSKTSLIKEPLWKKISGGGKTLASSCPRTGAPGDATGIPLASSPMRVTKTKADSPAEPLAISLSHAMRREETREGILELADEALDEIAAAGLILHAESHPKTGEGGKR